MSSQRAALVETLWLRDGQHRDHREAQADAVIQYLWQRADDPEVQISLAKTYTSYWESIGETAQGLLMDEAKVDITDVLTALLGPRPEQEAE